MKRILTVLGISFLSLIIPFTQASAQSGYQVKGVVVDASGPVVGATIMEKGTMTGTSTGTDGDYILVVSNANTQIVVSCIGYTNQTFVASKMPAKVVLVEDSEFIQDAVVIGYGSLSKKELSSSIVQVEKKDFLKGGMNNPMEMLTGKVAGLVVNTTAAANPNSSSNLQIRGATSLIAGNSPLIVIDGVPGGDIRNVAAQDIESMTVLKDAASAAIYGTRGANGVILITTKKGSSDEPGTSHITYDSYFGANFVKDIPSILSPDEFRRSRRGTDYGYNTDWYNLLLRDFSYENNQYLSIDGNSKNGSYNASVNYKDATGLDTAVKREEYGARIAVEQRAIKDYLQLNVSLNARRVNETWGNDGMFDTALTMNPTMPVYNADGTYYQPISPTGAKNPVQTLDVVDNNGQRNYLLGTAEAKVNIIKTNTQSLNTALSYSLNYNDLKSKYYTPSTSGESYWGGYAGQASIAYNKYWTNNIEWLANYSLFLGDHNIRAVAGYSYEESWYETVGATNYDFTFDNMKYNDLGSGTYLAGGRASMYSGKSLSKLIGIFGRVNYNWKDMLMASASLRYEGSTKFGANHKWGYFPAASLAWEMTKMPFMANTSSYIQSLKPRISYGVTGRSDFDAYKSLSTYSTRGNYFIDGEWVKGYAPSVNANPSLGWEKLVSVNAGVDFAVLGNRLRGSVDVYDRQSQDLLYNYTAPQPPYVYSNILVNVGTTENKGIEVSLDGDIFNGKDFGWTSGVNFSTGTTKLKKLSNSIYNASYVEMYLKPGVGTSEYFFRIQEGSKVGQFYGYQYAGADDSGDMLIYDKDGNKVSVGTADPSWKKYIGSGAPKFFLSWNNTFRYKNFDLNMFWDGAFGFKIFNMRRYGMGLKSCGTDNVLRDAYAKYNYLSTGGGVISSFFLEKGDYFKLQTVTLGYNFKPKNTDILSNLRIFLTAKNLYTITGYSGNDPSTVGITGLTPSIDVNSAYPHATQVSLGVTATF